MKTFIRKMGNSQGVLLPKPFLAQAGMDLGEVEIAVENDAIVIRKPQQSVRAGWAEASRRIAQAGDDTPAWPEFANEGDGKPAW